MRTSLLSVVLATALLVAAPVHAQETTSGSIAAEVRDSQGAAVPGATATLSGVTGSQVMVTDSQGRFFAPFLAPGTYAVTVELTGFSPVTRRNIAVRLGQRVSLEFTLMVGDLQEDPTFSAGASEVVPHALGRAMAF